MNEAPDERKDGPKPRRRANSLDGRTWTRHSISVWSDLRKTPAEAALKHPAMFPTALPARLIECFTPAGAGLVLDPFAGTGSTLAAALLAGKSAIGFDLSPRYAELARERCVDAIRESGNGVRFDIQSRDALTLGECLAPASVDLCVTSPPYWDILLRRRTADGKDQRDYGDAVGDLGKIESYEAFLGSLEAIFGKVLGVLKPGAYLCAVVMDIRKRSVFYPFHSDLAARLQRSVKISI